MLVFHICSTQKLALFSLTLPSLSMPSTKWCPALNSMFIYLWKFSLTLGKWELDVSGASWHISVTSHFWKVMKCRSGEDQKMKLCRRVLLETQRWRYLWDILWKVKDEIQNCQKLMEKGSKNLLLLWFCCFQSPHRQHLDDCSAGHTTPLLLGK